MALERSFAAASMTLLLLAACGAPKSPPPGNDASVAVAEAPLAPLSAPLRTSERTNEPDFDLAIGEAVVIDGIPLAGPSNPTGDAIDFRGLPHGKLVVFGRQGGLAALHYTDAAGAGQTRHFRITEIMCRPQPLHPPIILGMDDRAFVQVADLQAVEALPHGQPLVAGTGVDRSGSRFVVYGAAEGHQSVLATRRDGSFELYDVYVGGACADRKYSSIVPATPPGVIGPRGDGTCQRVDGTKTFDASCPDPTTVEKLSKDAFSSIACGWLEACGRRGYEGCCVDCKSDFAMKLERTCALKMLRQKTCADVVKLADAKGCIH